MQTLEKLSKKLKVISYINLGGCGIAAYAVLKYLKIYHPELLKTISVVFCYEVYLLSTYETNRLLLSTRARRYSIPTHIVIKVGKNKYFDADGFSSYRKYWKWVHMLPKTDEMSILLSTINNPRDSWWNTYFDREKNIPKIEKALKIDLSEIKRE